MTTSQGWRQACGQWRFGVLLSILLAALAGPPVLFGFGLESVWFELLLDALMLAAILALCFDRLQRLLALVLGVPSLALSIGGSALGGAAGADSRFLGHVCVILFCFGAAVLIVRALFTDRDRTLDSVLGAASGYLFLGLGWALLYGLVEAAAPGSFAVSRALTTAGDPPQPLPHVLTYYSFVTLTTVGYGDVTPVSPAARTFAWLEALAGQFYLAVIVAGLVSVLAAQAPGDREA